MAELHMYMKSHDINDSTVMVYQMYDENGIARLKQEISNISSPMKYDPLFMVDTSLHRFTTADNDLGTISIINRHKLDLFLSPFKYKGNHLFPVLIDNIGKGLKIKERNRHRVCPVCGDIYSFKMSDLKRNSNLTCGKVMCKKSFEKDRSTLQTRTCVACGNKFSALINNKYESDYKTLNNSFCTHECILNAIPDVYLFKHNEQYNKFTEGYTDEFNTIMHNLFESGIIPPSMKLSFDQVVCMRLGKVIDSYGNEYELYDLIK